MNKNDIIKQITSELMYEDEWLEFYEAMDLATQIYENMFQEGEDGI